MLHFIDTHIHSDNSRDAHHSVTLICEKAIQKGLESITITDHCECFEYEKYNYALTCRQSAFEARKAKQVFKGQIEVLSGVEIGSPLRDLNAVEDVLKNNYDFILGSMHIIMGKKKSFKDLDYTRQANRPEFLIKRYLDDVIEMVDWNGFDSLAHLTYPLRYYPESVLADFDIMQYKEEIEHIFKSLAKNGKALEINTSGGGYSLKGITGELHPCFEFVKLFKELGGELITIGSDAHSANDVGYRINDAIEIAKAAGFKSFAVYKNRVPTEIGIL